MMTGGTPILGNHHMGIDLELFMNVWGNKKAIYIFTEYCAPIDHETKGAHKRPIYVDDCFFKKSGVFMAMSAYQGGKWR